MARKRQQFRGPDGPVYFDPADVVFISSAYTYVTVDPYTKVEHSYVRRLVCIGDNPNASTYILDEPSNMERLI